MMKSSLLSDYIRCVVSEVAGNYSMSATRRMQAPGNVRSGFNTKGSRSSLENDLEMDSFSNRQEEDSMPKAAVCFLTKNGKVLAVSRGEDMSNMNMPGGTVELGEDPLETAKRELFEETGLEALEIFPVYSQVNGGWLVTTYRVPSYKGTLKGSWEGHPSWEKPEVLKGGAHGKYFENMLAALRGNEL